MTKTTKKKTTKKKATKKKPPKMGPEPPRQPRMQIPPATFKSLNGCNAIGVSYPDTSMVVMSDIADALGENAKALGVLASVLKPTSIQIQSLYSM